MVRERHSGVGLKEQAVSGMLWSGGTRIGTQVLDQVFTVFLVRLLAPQDFGLIAMAAVFTSLLNVFADMGLARAVVQRETIDEEYLSTAFWANVVTALFLTAIGLAAAGPIARLYGEPLAGPVLAALSLRFLLVGGSATHVAVLTREMRFSALTTRSLVSSAVGGTVGVALALAGAGVWSLVAQALATFLSRTVLLWVVTTWRPRWRFSWQKARDLWSFGGHLLGARIFSYVIKQSDNFVIGRALGAAMLGYYAFAYALFLAPLMDISGIVGRVTLAAFSRLQRDVGRLRRGFNETSTYISLFALPVLIGFFLVTPDLVTIVFGPKWLPAVPPLRLLLIAGLLQSHANLWQTMFQVMNKPQWVLAWGIISACVYVPAFLVGLRWGIVGVAAGYLASTLLLVPFQLRQVQRLLGFRLWEYFEGSIPLLGASVVMAAAILLSQRLIPGEGTAGAVRLALSMTAGGAGYLGTVFLLRRDLLASLLRILTRLRRAPAAELVEETV
ncbi:MAG TPA: lipopolysaccharide biosynthesis protein [bacterium]|jgi:PST family polysaccharide transporter|nr:lipopolysaccharide biosynthesis protein [bacterium]